MVVKHIGYGVLRGANGECFICDCDGFGNIESMETGVLYRATKRDEHQNIVEIEEL